VNTHPLEDIEKRRAEELYQVKLLRSRFPEKLNRTALRDFERQARRHFGLTSWQVQDFLRTGKYTH